MLNESKGNMYDWVTHTWNPVKGTCFHNCEYCYMKKWGNKQKPVRLVESELRTNLGSGNTIFVGSSCDMWAKDIFPSWISRTLACCDKYCQNTYLFQSKNPRRFHFFESEILSNSIWGTTVESDLWHTEMGNSPHPLARLDVMRNLKESGLKTTITIEPVMAFSKKFIDYIFDAKPDWVNIGANTYGNVKLKEPSADALKNFIDQIQGVTEVKIKPNLKKLLNGN